MATQSYAVTIRFYEELNDFLPVEQRKRDFVVESCCRRSVKDLIESLGVPHVEVDLILVNGRSVPFSHIIREGDRISAYPEFERLDISGVTRLRPRELRKPRFILDVHLRKLARYIRLLGFDADYREHCDDRELAEISHLDKRILLTRDRQLLNRKIIDRGLFIRNNEAEKQAAEVLERMDLWMKVRAFARCIECNGLLKPLRGPRLEQEKHRIPEGVLAWCGEFHFCDACGRIYWKGSHYERLRHRIDRIIHQHTAGIRTPEVDL